jgi:hypothetical protein
MNTKFLQAHYQCLIDKSNRFYNDSTNPDNSSIEQSALLGIAAQFAISAQEFWFKCFQNKVTLAVVHSDYENEIM